MITGTHEHSGFSEAPVPFGGAGAVEVAPVDPGPFGRKIIHVDMDAFFASVEQRDNPHLRGKPVAVGGTRERGVVAAASYEARKFGVRSAMPSAKARRLCPQLIFVPHRFEVYKAVSRQIRGIFARYTPLIEPLSLDEAYLDVTENLVHAPSATWIAEEIRAAILAETGLTASAGVSYCKFIAKLASDQNKPNGICVIPPEKGPAFVESLPVGRFHGIGPATEEKMHRLGILTGADLKAQSLEALTRAFGKSGPWYHDLARGIDHRRVQPDRQRKSIGSETTFFPDLATAPECVGALEPLIEDVWRHATRMQARGRTVTLKLRTSDFVTITRAHSHPHFMADRETFRHTALDLLAGQMPPKKGIRLLGVTLSGLEGEHGPEPRQLEFDLE